MWRMRWPIPFGGIGRSAARRAGDACLAEARKAKAGAAAKPNIAVRCSRRVTVNSFVQGIQESGMRRVLPVALAVIAFWAIASHAQQPAPAPAPAGQDAAGRGRGGR